MTDRSCGREDDLLAAIQSARWPDRADEALRAHVTACEACRDLALVAPPLLSAADDAVSPGTLPDARAVWLRAQWRARADAKRVAARPIAATQAIALAGLAGALGAFLGASSSSLQSGLALVREAFARAVPDSTAWSALTGPVESHVWLVAMAVLGLIVAPALVLVVTRAEAK